MSLVIAIINNNSILNFRNIRGYAMKMLIIIGGVMVATAVSSTGIPVFWLLIFLFFPFLLFFFQLLIEWGIIGVSSVAATNGRRKGVAAAAAAANGKKRRNFTGCQWPLKNYQNHHDGFFGGFSMQRKHLQLLYQPLGYTQKTFLGVSQWLKLSVIGVPFALKIQQRGVSLLRYPGL